ncbi:hypothetical protein Bca4012_076110 [Brassica carinata]
MTFPFILILSSPLTAWCFPDASLGITTVLYLKDEITIATPGALDRYMHLFCI